jgi:hypothetical protein
MRIRAALAASGVTETDAADDPDPAELAAAGLTQEAIAARLGVTRAVVRRALARARLAAATAAAPVPGYVTATVTGTASTATMVTGHRMVTGQRMVTVAGMVAVLSHGHHS